MCDILSTCGNEKGESEKSGRVFRLNSRNSFLSFCVALFGFVEMTIRLCKIRCIYQKIYNEIETKKGMKNSKINVNGFFFVFFSGII